MTRNDTKIKKENATDDNWYLQSYSLDHLKQVFGQKHQLKSGLTEE